VPAVKKKSARAKAKKQSTFARLFDLFHRYTIAGVAGMAVLVAAIIAALWAGGYFGAAGRAAGAGIHAAAAQAGLKVARVTLRGAHETATDEILAAVGPVIGKPMLAVSADEVRARVERLGWVRAAAVTRLYPDTLHISIRERTPAAVWQEDYALNLIDESGAIIRRVNDSEYLNLPLIVGAGAPEAAAGVLGALGRHDSLEYMTYALVRVGGRRWNMRLRNGVEVRLPAAGFESAIDAIALMQAAHGALDQPIEYIDLRDPERMIVKKRGAPETIGPSG